MLLSNHTYRKWLSYINKFINWRFVIFKTFNTAAKNDKYLVTRIIENKESEIASLKIEWTSLKRCFSELEGH